MTAHALSVADRGFRADFESGALAAAAFDHRAHVRLAYVLLAEAPPERATELMRASLKAFIARNGVDPAKYHETMTAAWILAVHHFMALTEPCASADEFIAKNPVLLDSKIMLTHYSAGLLFSPEARAGFVEPDLDAIPRHEPPRG